MAMTLRLTDKQTALLKRVADIEGVSMHEVVVTAVEEYVNRRQARLISAIERIKKEDKEILDRLAK